MKTTLQKYYRKSNLINLYCKDMFVLNPEDVDLKITEDNKIEYNPYFKALGLFSVFILTTIIVIAFMQNSLFGSVVLGGSLLCSYWLYKLGCYSIGKHKTPKLLKSHANYSDKFKNNMLEESEKIPYLDLYYKYEIDSLIKAITNSKKVLNTFPYTYWIDIIAKSEQLYEKYNLDDGIKYKKGNLDEFLITFIKKALILNEELLLIPLDKHLSSFILYADFSTTYTEYDMEKNEDIKNSVLNLINSIDSELNTCLELNEIENSTYEEKIKQIINQ